MAEVGLDQGPQFRRHLRAHPEPELKAPHRLMQQHAEPVGGGKPARAGGRQQRGFQRRIDQIGDHGVRVQRREIDLERRLPGHAERGGVDQQAGAGQQMRQRRQCAGCTAGAEALAQRLAPAPACG